MKNMIKENFVKNAVIFLMLIPSYFCISSSILTSVFASDKSVLGSMLVAVSILSVIACFGNFAFTYEKVNQKSAVHRLFAHVTTGLLMLLIGLSLEMTSVLTRQLFGPFLLFDASLFILYIASVLYDFWDLFRVNPEFRL